MKKHTLSFCEITELENNIFEIIVFEGVEVNKSCAEEEFKFWEKINPQSKFHILLNCENSFTYDFMGAAEIGKYPMQDKVAIVVYDHVLYSENSMAVQINRSEGENPDKNVRLFNIKQAAINWLND